MKWLYNNGCLINANIDIFEYYYVFEKIYNIIFNFMISSIKYDFADNSDGDSDDGLLYINVDSLEYYLKKCCT